MPWPVESPHAAAGYAFSRLRAAEAAPPRSPRRGSIHGGSAGGGADADADAGEQFRMAGGPAATAIAPLRMAQRIAWQQGNTLSDHVRQLVGMSQ
jgi:hypothetical protein